MPDRTSSRSARAAVEELPIVRRFRSKPDGPTGFMKPRILRWVLAGGAALVALVVMAFLGQGLSNIVVHASTALALFFLLFALGLIVNLGKRAAVVAFVVTGILYSITAWTSLGGVQSVLILAVVVAFFVYGLAGFNVLFVVEEVLFDIHRKLHIRGSFWSALPTFIILGTLPLVYWILPGLGLNWPTLKVAMPVVVLLLVTAWIMRWRAGPHAMKLVREAHLLAIGTITGAGLADIVALLASVEGIIPSIVAYLILIITWIFVSYNTLQRAQYFLKGGDVLPWMAILFASGFAILAHVNFLYGAAGAPGLAAVSQVRVSYLVFGVWLGLLFFVIRGAWRFFRFVRDEQALGARTRRNAGRFARVMEEMMQSPSVMKRTGGKILHSVDRVIPGGPKRETDKSRDDRRNRQRKSD